MNQLYRSKLGARLVFLFFIFTVPVYGQGHVEIIEKAKTKNFNELVQLVEAHYADRDKGKGSGYKQFKRWEYFHSTRLDENGNVVNVAQRNLEAAGAEKQRTSQARIISDSPGNWKSWGPLVTKHENYNGRINCVAVDPANPAIIYAGSASGGLWRSTDDGASWECLTDQLSSTIGVTSIVIDHSSPVDNRTLYMLTGDRPLGVVSSLGVWKSTDNGNSWRKTRAPIGDQIDDTIDLGYKLIMHPDNNQVLLYSNRKGIFKSLDAGATWTQKINGVFTDVEFHPADPSIVHAAGYQGTYRSSDTGETWHFVSTGPAGLRIEIAVTPADPAYVYALAGGSHSTDGVFRSTDHGLTYTQVPSSFRFSGKYWYNLAFAASPTDVNTLYGGEVLSYKSVDGGLNWSREQLGHVDHHAMEFYNGYLYVGNDGGVIRKNPITNTVENLSEGLGITQIYKLGHNPHDAGKMLIGSQDNGTGILSNNYSDIIGGGDGMECFYDPLDTNLLYFTTQNGNLYRYNLNSSFSTTNINPPGTRGTGAWVTPFLRDPIDPYAIYAGFRDVWKNPRHGSFDWINLTNGATGTDEATLVTVAPSDNNYIYVVKSSRALYRTTDGGQTWTITQTEGATPRFTSISIHPENPDILWATGEWFGAYGDGLRVGKSTDGGKTWTNISGSLPNVTTNCSVYQKGTANGIYIGNDLGVYYKDDTMSDWVSFDAGMPYTIVTDLEINHAAGKIYAATYGRGAWVSDLYSNPSIPCQAEGRVTREYWSDIAGTSVSDIPVHLPPTTSGQLNIFEGPSNVGTNYGSRISGYICAPATGSYIFWISSDDRSELWLSTDDDPANKVKIASVSGWTNARQWSKYSTQQSLPVTLQEGGKYYIEALHKEASGGDHVAVGWQLPDGTMERPIPGNRLSPFTPVRNVLPEVSITFPANGASFSIGEPIEITAKAFDQDGEITKVEFFQNGSKLGEDTGSPYSFTWGSPPEGIYSLTAKATDDDGGVTVSDTVDIAVMSNCTAQGTITREYWTDVSGTRVSDIPTHLPPAATGELTIFEGPSNVADNYGSRIRGYICPPGTGSYTFWIASDDRSELWLSTDEDPANKRKIAWVTGWTLEGDWNKYSTQGSAPVQLTGGQKYYIEALHKEGSGEDHVAVGWRLPDGGLERPIPGNRLSPFTVEANDPPVISITSPADGSSFPAGASINITVDASDTDGTITKVAFFQNGSKLGEDMVSPYTLDWITPGEGNYALTATATDNGGKVTVSDAVNISVTPDCIAQGTITREYWGNIAGTSVSDIPTHLSPTATGELTIFEGPSDVADNYGSRIRGYICPPTTGSYIFWIASDDRSELWLSTDDDPANKTRIASVNGWTNTRQWTKYAAQQSLPVSLKAGNTYYIEALHKEASGSDHVSVGWQLPDGALERPIEGNRLSPFSQTASAGMQYDTNVSLSDAEKPSIEIFPNPAGKGGIRLTLTNFAGTADEKVASVQIMTMTGLQLYEEQVTCETGCNTISLFITKEFPPGIYMVQAVVNRRRAAGKLFVN